MLRLLKAEEPLTPGAAITGADGKELGQVGTAAESPANGAIALTVLRREAQPGDSVDAGGVQAVVLDVNSIAN